MKVLVVDDSALLRKRLISMIPELPGVTALGQDQGAPEALNSVQEFNPDVVILDIRLSDGNGIEVSKKMKKDNSAAVTIMFTNYPYTQYRKKCQEAGADFFFDKSTEFHRIMDVLKHIQESQSDAAENLNTKRFKHDISVPNTHSSPRPRPSLPRQGRLK
ncbi:MAG: response regulator transcription factor [Candidatus Aminicenantes bacterium]|jgi:DNA-binding NarL/FixJ family response regulator